MSAQKVMVKIRYYQQDINALDVNNLFTLVVCFACLCSDVLVGVDQSLRDLFHACNEIFSRLVTNFVVIC